MMDAKELVKLLNLLGSVEKVAKKYGKSRQYIDRKRNEFNIVCEKQSKDVIIEKTYKHKVKRKQIKRVYFIKEKL